MDDELEQQAAEQRAQMVAEGVLNPDGSQRHTCPWCCSSYGFVLDGAGRSHRRALRELEQRARLWRWLHPRRTARLVGRLDAYADVLDDAGK